MPGLSRLPGSSMDLDCPRIDIGACRCTRGLSLIKSDNSAFYPKAGLFHVGRFLFKVRMCLHMGAHYWHWLVHKPPGVRSVVLLPNRLYQNYTIVMILDPDLHSISGTFRSLMMNADTRIGGVSTSVLVWRIQRAIRQFLRRKMERKLLTLAMVSHARLGIGSPWINLPTDLWAKIAGCARGTSLMN